MYHRIGSKLFKMSRMSNIRIRDFAGTKSRVSLTYFDPFNITYRIQGDEFRGIELNSHYSWDFEDRDKAKSLYHTLKRKRYIWEGDVLRRSDEKMRNYLE